MATDRHLLTDLRLVLRHRRLRPVYEAATVRRRVPNKTGLFEDLATLDGRDNLAQAVIMRLLTPRGELAALGHPEYGSRLHELIGERNTPTNRNRVRLHILEALQREPRIAEVLDLVVTPAGVEANARAEGVRNRVDVLLRVQPTGEALPVTIGPFTLALES